ncbi:probable serine/threonine-protein kinase kinX [Chaetodon trifascialis]|uniref:probable serine/threonine-protein kinase kinX n=1 Tax=Chaetodon trifascialis TaxID=109706 RepID=UPI00399697A6
MLDHCNQTVLSLLFGCLACLVVTSVVNADGRVFVLDLRNSSGLQGFRDAERACASRHARLASSAELRHAVVECFFSPCTRGWLYGGTVGTTVCNVVGSALKAVDVRTENATEDAAHLDAFCIKDRGVPCGDPPSFPNARLQGHSGYEMGDELLYTCMPGYVMPSGHRAFSLLCDSCGEWYGLVEICVKDKTESHIDYEDKFPDSYGEAERHSERPEEARGEVYEEVHGATYPEGKMNQEQQETSFTVEVGEEHQDQHEEHAAGGRKVDGAVEEGEKEVDRAVEDFIGHPRLEQERREVAMTDAATATEAPVSLLSQKHLFWFPSEAFQDEGHPVSTHPVTQTIQRASGAQSEESKEHESQERHQHQHPDDGDDHDHDPDSYDDHDTDDRDDHDNSNHDDLDAHDNSHHDDQDDSDSHHDEDDRDDPVKHYIPTQHGHLDRQDRYENHDDHDDHYDMGEHEDDRDRVRYGGQEYDDTYDEHDRYEDHKDVTEDRGEDDREHPDGSKEHPDHDDHDDGEVHYDLEEDDNERYTDHDDHDNHDDHDDHDDHHDHDDHDDHLDHHDHDDHDDHHDHDNYDDHDSHEDSDDSRQHVIFSIATDEHQNVTQKGDRGKATTDETWLDGYPVVLAETENEDSITKRVRPEDRERGAADRPNDVEVGRPVPYTSSPEVPKSPTAEPALEQGGVKKMWPGFVHTAAPSPDLSQPSDSPTYPDSLDYDTQQAAPTRSWLGDLTEHPFLDHDPAPPVHNGDILMEEHTVGTLPGETGERSEMEGELGENICTGENCPPPSSSGRGPTVAAIIVVVCAAAVAVIVGVWCYRRQQQKSSMYEMNGKGQSQTRQGQHIEMQQKV